MLEYTAGMIFVWNQASIVEKQLNDSVLRPEYLLTAAIRLCSNALSLSKEAFCAKYKDIDQSLNKYVPFSDLNYASIRAEAVSIQNLFVQYGLASYDLFVSLIMNSSSDDAADTKMIRFIKDSAEAEKYDSKKMLIAAADKDKQVSGSGFTRFLLENPTRFISSFLALDKQHRQSADKPAFTKLVGSRQGSSSASAAAQPSSELKYTAASALVLHIGRKIADAHSSKTLHCEYVAAALFLFASDVDRLQREEFCKKYNVSLNLGYDNMLKEGRELEALLSSCHINAASAYSVIKLSLDMQSSPDNAKTRYTSDAMLKAAAVNGVVSSTSLMRIYLRYPTPLMTKLLGLTGGNPISGSAGKAAASNPSSGTKAASTVNADTKKPVSADIKKSADTKKAETAPEKKAVASVSSSKPVSTGNGFIDVSTGLSIAQFLSSPAKYSVSDLTLAVEKMQRELMMHVIGQDHAIEAFKSGMFQLGLSVKGGISNKQPRAIFTFMGSPGCGKTYLAECAGELLGLHVEKLDMSSYSDNSAITTLCGVAKTYKDSRPGVLTSAIKQHPETLLIIDEVEKANSQVLNLFLQVLSSGILKDLNTEESVDFSKTIIIFTTNAGKRLYNSGINDVTNISKSVLTDALRDSSDASTYAKFTPEFTSRLAFGELLLFSRLSTADFVKIGRLEAQKCASMLKNSTHTSLQLSDEVLYALLYNEGATVDARTYKARVSDFITDCVHDIEIAHAKGTISRGIDDASILQLDVDMSDATDEAAQLLSTKGYAPSRKVLNFNVRFSMSGDTVIAVVHGFKLERAVIAADRDTVLDDVDKPSVRFSDVVGASEAKRELEFLVEYIKEPAKFKALGVPQPRGILMYGKPGTGKTMLAKALAGECGASFIESKASDYVKQYAGTGPDAVRTLFEKARRYAPSIVFIDEVDSIARPRDLASPGMVGHAEATTLNALLAEMDGFKGNEKKPVFVIAATNADARKEGALDGAFIRRFSKSVKVELPNRAERAQLIEMRLKKIPKHAVTHDGIENIAERTDDASPAELERIMASAIQSCAQNGRMLDDAALIDAMEQMLFGEKRQRAKEQILRYAQHEAGHALMLVLSGEKPQFATIESRGDHGGYVALPAVDGIMTRRQIISRLRACLGGRAAEIIYYGEDQGSSSGASGDLATASEYARMMICDLGMDDEFGPAVIPESAARGALASAIQKRVSQIVRAELDSTVQLLSESKHILDKLALQLIKKERLTGDEIIAITGAPNHQ